MKSNNIPESDQVPGLVYLIKKRKKLAGRNCFMGARRVWRYQKGNQNPWIEEEQTTRWPKEKLQKDKRWSTKHTHTTKVRLTLKTSSISEMMRLCKLWAKCRTSYIAWWIALFYSWNILKCMKNLTKSQEA